MGTPSHKSPEIRERFLRNKHITSWLAILFAFLFILVICLIWRRLGSPPLDSARVKLMYDSGQILHDMEPSVVTFWATRKKDQETQFGCIGSGVIIDPRGYVLTSADIDLDDIESLQVIDYLGEQYEAETIKTDAKTKLTLLRLTGGAAMGTGGFSFAPLGDSQEVEGDDWVIALGGRRIPSGWELAAETGRVTRNHQSLIIDKFKYRDLIQTDIALGSEYNGGPLVNSKGEVIGLCVPFVQPFSGNAEQSPPFSYALPINHGRILWASLPIPRWTEGPTGRVCNWLGAQVRPVDPVIATHLELGDASGLLINEVTNNSPAERAGLRRGDVISQINNERTADLAAVEELVPQFSQQRKIAVTVIRDGQERSLSLYWQNTIYSLPRTGSLPEVFVVLLIFTLIYYLVYRDLFDRVVLFVLGAIIVAIIGHYLGFYDQLELRNALMSKIDVLCFLVGMNLVAAVLEDAGLFDFLAKKIAVATNGDKWKIMFLFCLLTYVFSLAVNNLTTIIIIVPMILRLSRHLEFDPKIFLTSVIIASNLGGASTMVGDFPNMLIGTEIGLPFYQFTVYMLPICVLELFVLLAYLKVFHRDVFASAKKLGHALTSKGRQSNSTSGESKISRLWETDWLESSDHALGNADRFLDNIANNLPYAIRSPRALKRGLLILGIVIIGFLFSDVLHVPPAFIALTGGVFALALGGCEPLSLLRKINIRDILFFSALFILVGAAEASGMLGFISKMLTRFSFGNVLVLSLLLMWVGAFVTCFLNAGPSAALFLPVVLSFERAAPHNLYWWALSLGVCAGSSGTLMGATGGAVTATMLDKFRKTNEDESKGSSTETDPDTSDVSSLTFKEYAKLGLPVMFILLIISSVYITIIYRW